LRVYIAPAQSHAVAYAPIRRIANEEIKAMHILKAGVLNCEVLLLMMGVTTSNAARSRISIAAATRPAASLLASPISTSALRNLSSAVYHNWLAFNVADIEPRLGGFSFDLRSAPCLRLKPQWLIRSIPLRPQSR
jgi:hypothetical protein